MRFSFLVSIGFFALALAPPVWAQGGLWGDEVPLDAAEDDGLSDVVIPGDDGEGVGAEAVPGSFEAAVIDHRAGRFAEACATWLALAEQGLGSAQHNVAVCYDRGRGLPADPRRAAGWYWQAVEHTIPEALNNLAKLHTDGRGVDRDDHLAANLYARAADLGLADAQYNLAAAYYRGLGVAKDLRLSVEWMTRAAESGHVRAQYDLGGFLLAGVAGPPDPHAAARWYAAAANAGDAAATYALGFLHYRGDGVAKDLETSLALIERAARAGVVPAQNQAGVMRAKGEGGERDPVLAYHWFSLAHAMGDVAAGRNRDKLAPRLSADQISDAEARTDAFRPQPIEATGGGAVADAEFDINAF